MASQSSGINIFSIADPKLRAIFKTIQDKIDAVQGATGGAAWRGSPLAGGNQLKDLADATDPTDAVTLAQLTAATSTRRIADALSAAGTTPLNVTNLIGGGSVSSGTHAQRLAATPVDGNWFYETDRGALYVAISNNWILIVAIQNGSFASKPTDLGLNDGGFLWIAQNRGQILYWTGASWREVIGFYANTFANRPVDAAAPDNTSLGTGIIFAATDYGNQQWYYDRAAVAWKYLGGGTYAQDTLANIGTISALLGANDIGFKFYATDYDRLYQWTGTGWLDAPGQPCRGYWLPFDAAGVANLGNGWQLCDGSVVMVSQADASIISVSVPDLTSSRTYAAFDAADGAGTFGAVGVVYNDYAGIPMYRL